MEELSNPEQSLVSLGAALASNSMRCVEHYVSEARKGGYTDRQIAEAVRVADRVRRAPAQTVLDSAIGMLSQSNESELSSAGTGRTKADETRRAGEKKADSDGSPSQTARAARNGRCC